MLEEDGTTPFSNHFESSSYEGGISWNQISVLSSNANVVVSVVKNWGCPGTAITLKRWQSLWE
jgi:hypothetical protein